MEKRDLTYATAAAGRPPQQRSPRRSGRRALSHCLFRLILAIPPLFALLLAAPVLGKTAPETPITNQASVSYGYAGRQFTVFSNVDTFLVAAPPVAPEIALYRHAGSDAATLTTEMRTTSYASGGSGGPLQQIPPPVDLGAPVALRQESYFHAGQPIYVSVTDFSMNSSPDSVQGITVEITSSTGDVELLTLTETGANSGTFAGYLPTLQGGGSDGRYDGKLSVVDASEIVARYQDSAFGSEVIEAAALVDPLGRVFDSVTGNPVDGVSITLTFEDGSTPPIKGDDAESDYPDRVITGSTVSDTKGRVYDFAPGAYRFPLIGTGKYRLKVEVPEGVNYRFPSRRGDEQLQEVAGAPYALSAASRGGVFEVNPGPIVRIDIPLDPVVTGLWLQKNAGKATAAVGDFVPFAVALTNATPATTTGVVVSDRLPPALRYEQGSLRIAGSAAADPAISTDGRTLSFPVPDLAPGQVLKISYATRVIPGARPGTISNEVSASGANADSNIATASVKIVEDLFASRSIIMGSVTEGVCGGEGTPLKGARIYLEDGSFVVTDKRGMFHFEGVQPGSHVAQLDLQSLPKGYRLLTCQENNRFAGREFSQFVDMQGGSMWRTDFRVEREPVKKARKPKPLPPPAPTPAPAPPPVPEPPPAPAPPPPAPVAAPAPEPVPEPVIEEIHSEVGLALKSVVQGDTVTYQARLRGGPGSVRNQQLLLQLPSGVKFQQGSCDLEGAQLPDPVKEGEKLSLALPDCSGDWEKTLTFRGTLNRKVRAGGQMTSAVLSFDTPDRERISTPPAMNLLDLERKENRIALPEIVLHPKFPTFSAELVDEDKLKLDELAATLSDMVIAEIAVTGHTDNVRISARGKGTYRDNKALSLARAQSIGHYLMEKLKLTPDKIKLAGMGETDPAASNKTEKGRALNRRVELRVLAERRLETTLFKQVKDDSGFQKAAFTTVVRHHPAPLAAVAAPVAAAAVAPVAAAVVAPVEAAATVAAPAEQAVPPSSEAAATSPISPVSPTTATAAATDAAPVSDEAAVEEAEAEEPSPAADDLPTGAEKAEEGDNAPQFDQAWLENTEPGLEWVWPPELHFPPITSTHIAIKHHPTDKLTLSVNGEKVHPVLLEKVLKTPGNTVGLSYWRGVPLKYGDNKIVAEVKRANGETTVLERMVHVSTEPVKAELVPELSTLVADGKTPPVIALRLLDKDDSPARSGVAGKFSVAPPYEPFRKLADNLGNDPLEKDGVQYLVGSEGVAVIRLQPTSRSGEALVTLPLNEQDHEFRVWLSPEQRDWILVGIGEGTLGYQTLSANMEPIGQDAPEKGLYEDGRVAFFAKGSIKGKWLLTMALDTAKGKPAVGDGLFQTVDPESYYTLYGDASLQQHEAASREKLYLKIERDRFYALFGDFNTGLTVTELSRYSRTLTGLKSEYQGRNLEYNVFGSNTGQLFVKDELPGDGTSGLYRLTRRDIEPNSEKVSIEVRDRYRSEIILSKSNLARFVDYTIDYDAGTIFFKAPVPSTDSEFNPRYIVVDYETQNQGKESLTVGGRVGGKYDGGRIKGGISYIHEGQLSASGDLIGMDALWQINPEFQLRAETAATSTDFAGDKTSASSYLVELEKRSPQLNGLLYFRQLGEGFGLGQQNASEQGMRKFGLESSYKLRDRFSLSEQAYRQENLASGATSNVIEAKGLYTAQQYGLSLGGRYASDTLEDGSTQSSNQVLLGANWLTLDRKLNLHIQHDQSLGKSANTSFPTRTALGADYKITGTVVLSARQEFSSGEEGSTSSTNVGLKSNLWQGGMANTGMQRSMDENGSRLFALFGLKQLWKVSDRWSVDGGLDRSQALKRSDSSRVNPNAPPAVGGAEDFTALSLGSNYQEKMWGASSRIEVRSGEIEDKLGLVASLVGELAPGLGGSSRLQYLDSKGGEGERKTRGELRLGVAYRPLAGRWILLDRLDLITEQEDGGAVAVELDSRRIVNNLNANYQPHQRLQLSLQYGSKYASETIEGTSYSGYTDLIGIEGRYDLSKTWDIGARVSILHSWGAGVYTYSGGPSVGLSVMENAWVTLGYNLTGFSEKDFSATEYTAQGPYLNFRFKFDQQSVKDALLWMNR